MQINRTVDVIIPVYRPDAQKLQMLLDRLCRQTHPVSRIIVVNTGIQWYPDDEIKRPANMELYHIKEEDYDHGRTRDMAAGMSDADFMLFITQDALPADRRLVEYLVNAFEDPQVAAAYARQLARKTDSIQEKFTRNFNYPAESCVKTAADIKRLGIKTFFCSNSCAMYRKSIYEQLGGFVAHTIFNEDMIYASGAVRAGYSIAYCAQARVIHSHNYTAMQQFRRNFDNGVSHADNPEAFEGAASIGEGKKLVLRTAGYLIRHGKPLQLFTLARITAAKAAGFAMGKSYRKLPGPVVKLCTMNKKYWEEQKGENYGKD